MAPELKRTAAAIDLHIHLDFVCSWCYIDHHNLLSAIARLHAENLVTLTPGTTGSTTSKAPSLHEPSSRNNTASATTSPTPISLQIHHHPVFIDPLAPPFGLPSDAYLSRLQSPLHSLRSHARIPAIAALSGLSLNTDGLIGHTRRAHRLVRFVRMHSRGGMEREVVVLERLFRLFWVEGGDITARGHLARIGAAVLRREHGSGDEEAVGAEDVRRWLESEEGVDEVDAEAEKWVDDRERGERRGVPFSRVVLRVRDEVIGQLEVDGSRSAEEWEAILRKALADARQDDG